MIAHNFRGGLLSSWNTPMWLVFKCSQKDLYYWSKVTWGWTFHCLTARVIIYTVQSKFRVLYFRLALWTLSCLHKSDRPCFKLMSFGPGIAEAVTKSEVWYLTQSSAPQQKICRILPLWFTDAASITPKTIFLIDIKWYCSIEANVLWCASGSCQIRIWPLICLVLTGCTK